MPEKTTPGLGNSVNDALALSTLLRPCWDEITAAIPAWHPRNEETPEERAAREAAEAAQVDWESDENPYKKRHADTQSAYTQNQQRLKELERYENDPQAYYELGAKHNVKFEFPGQQQREDEDPQIAELRQQNAELMQWRQQVDAQMQAERQSAGMELFHQDLDEWAEEAGVKLAKKDHNAIYGLLMQSGDPTQEHYAKAAFEAHVADMKADAEAQRTAWEEERRRPRVPTVPMNGQAHTGQPKWSEMSDSQINEHMAQRMAGNV